MEGGLGQSTAGFNPSQQENCEALGAYSSPVSPVNLGLGLHNPTSQLLSSLSLSSHFPYTEKPAFPTPNLDVPIACLH